MSDLEDCAKAKAAVTGDGRANERRSIDKVNDT